MNRTDRIVVPIEEEIRDMLSRQANKEGKTLAAYCRKILITDLSGKGLVPLDTALSLLTG